MATSAPDLSLAGNSELLATADHFRSVGYERADEIEQARRLPADLSAALAKAGLYRMGIPARVGGLETRPTLSSQVVEILAQGDASCAWVVFIATTSGTALAGLPETGARKLFPRPEALVTGVFAPTGTAETVAGGFKVNGRWQWGSGSQNADWCLGGCRLLENGEPLRDAKGRPRHHMLAFPKAQMEFIDTWHVSGLSGSGSLDYQVKDLFVPEDLAVGYLPPDPGARTPLYAFPNFTFLALGIGAVCLGLARAAITELTALAAEKKRAGSSKTVAQNPMAQSQLAKAEASLRSARLFYYDSLDRAWDNATTQRQVSLEERRDVRLAVTHTVQTALDVVDAMYHLGGGSSVYRTSRLQRCFRDVHVAAQHIMVAPSTLETVGRTLFGVEADTSML